MPAAPSPRASARRTAVLLAATVAAALMPLVAQTRTAARAADAAPGGGYWLVASDGGIFAFGDVGFHGSTGDIRLNQPIVTMAPTRRSAGYWMAASDGGIFAFGDAGFFGSTGAMTLNRPIVGMAPTPTGAGYWLVASDGGIFAFGDAAYRGSAVERSPGAHVIGMAPTRTGGGYWQASAAGEVWAFGDAAALGSTGPVNQPIVGLSPTPTGAGYWLVARDGGVFSFGDAGFFGSTGAIRLNQPIVGLAGGPAAGGTPGPGPSTGAGGSTSPTIGGSTTPTTSPGSADDPLEPVVPRDSPHGGTSTADLPRDGTDCGLPSAPEKIDQPLQADNIGETSGMVASPRYPGVYWTIRDSGHTAAVNAVRIDGAGMATAREILVGGGAFNHDWEEINYTTGPDGRGRLWIVASGQGNAPRQIVEVLEPHPDNDTSAELLNIYDYAWPNGHTYNTEASFFHKGRLVIVSKTTPHANMYRFERLTPGVLNVPSYIGQLGNSKDISVIRQSPDGKYLLTAAHQAVHLYKSTDGSGSLNSFNGRLPDCELLAFPDQVSPERGGNVEAGEFSANREMVFMDEVKVVYRLRLEG